MTIIAAVSKERSASTSVDTRQDKRDAHLRSPDFFDVAKYPSATFVSTSVARGGSGFQVSGNLTLHGVTKPVVLDVSGSGTPIASPMDKKQHLGFEATTTIHRLDFGVGPTFPDAVVSDEVKITIELDAVKQ